MIIENEAGVTKAVLKVMEQTKDERLREIMISLIKHLHGFIRDVKLSEKEFQQATRILNEIGQASSDTHNEAVLMSGSLGVSCLVCLLNNGDEGRTETTQSMLGPFWRMNSPATQNGNSIVRSPTQGEKMLVDLTIRDQAGNPVTDAKVDIWHCSAEGFYENQDDSQADMNLRGQFETDQQGRIWFESIKQSGYPIPTDTVVGRLLEAQNRHPFRPAHIHVLAYKEGYKTLISQIYADDDENLKSDVQFGVTRALVGKFEFHNNTENAKDSGWYSLSHDLVMEPGEANLPIPPIK